MGRALTRIGGALGLLAVALMHAGCDEDVGPVDCAVVGGKIRVLMLETVRADSVHRTLGAVGLEYDTTSVADCCRLYFDVLGGEPADYLRTLSMATGSRAIGVWSGGRIFAALCTGDPSAAVAAGEEIPGLRFHGLEWYAIDAIVGVPVGTEDAWVAAFNTYAFVDTAGRVVGCVGGGY